MKGIGGPLLCIGDLLSDLEEEEGVKRHVVDDHAKQSPTSPPQQHALFSDQNDSVPQSQDLKLLFQDSYSQLNEALAGSDHSWTALTLKLCTALETANKLVQCTNSNAIVLFQQIGELKKIVERADSAAEAAKSIQVFLKQEERVKTIV